jgi:hypothetical protein
MGRGDKKRPVSAPETEKPLPVAAATRAPIPRHDEAVPAQREGTSIPRTTTDNLWRDLHPTRVWPD